MKKAKVAVAIVAAGAVTGLIAPTTASAAPKGSNGNPNPSCAALWAHIKNEGYLPPLGIAQKELGKGFAAYIAQSKVFDDGYGYCGNE